MEQGREEVEQGRGRGALSDRLSITATDLKTAGLVLVTGWHLQALLQKAGRSYLCSQGLPLDQVNPLRAQINHSEAASLACRKQPWHKAESRSESRLVSLQHKSIFFCQVAENTESLITPKAAEGLKRPMASVLPALGPDTEKRGTQWHSEL